MAAAQKQAKRKPAPALTRERIAQAALAHIEANGRDALSMRSLASDLHCEAMSLYHHVDGIDGVLDAVVDRLLGMIVGKARTARDPRKALEAYARAFLTLAETYPNAFPLIATRLWHTPHALAAAGLAVALLRELGLAPRSALRQARLLGAYLNGAGLAIAAWRAAGDLSRRGAKAATKDPQLAPLAGDIDAAAVRADLEAGLMQILASVK